MASINWQVHEPFGMVIVEAMALGKPIVAANSAGPTEIITDEVDGMLTPPGDAHALAIAVNRYLQNTEWANRIASNARQRAMQFSSKKFANEVCTAFFSGPLDTRSDKFAAVAPDRAI